MRTLDELAKLPYDQMTNEEIELVLEWKASVKASEDTFKKMQEQNFASNQAILEITRTIAQANEIKVSELAQQAMDRLKANDYGQA